MIRNLLTLILFFVIQYSFAQEKEVKEINKKLNKVVTLKDAETFIQENPKWFGEIVTINARKDSSAIAKRLLGESKGYKYMEDAPDNRIKYIFKVISSEEQVSFRVNYIYLDGEVHASSAIDSLRKVIFSRCSAGESFEELAKEFSMDGNGKNGGDLGWFEEHHMVRAFSDAVKSHKQGEIFNVDILEKQWFYVVKNTYEPVRYKSANVLVLKVVNIQ